MSANNLNIRVEKLGKRFDRVHEKPMLLRETAGIFAGRSQKSVDDLWAVRNVSFELAKGETLGVLGRNGSGKSTLLTLVAGTSFPSEGSVSTRGRISTLLQLGAGFHVDMTGEENIMVNAGLLGLSADEVKRRTPQIVEFAELQDAIDTQIRYYSSGMLARLGFSIAINVSPDIVVVDEVLAVGDLGFQKKCMGAVKDLQKGGATIVLASQAPVLVASLSTKAIWLEKGEIKMAGDPSEVAAEYNAEMAK